MLPSAHFGIRVQVKTGNLMRWLGAACLAGALTLASGCSGENLSGRDEAGAGGSGGQAADAGGNAGDSSSGAGGEASVTSCPSDLPGPAMALLSTPSGISYCIDTTEVTQGQYAEFVAAYVPPTEQVHDLCPEPNTVLEPLDGQGQFCPPGSYAPDETPERAVDCITFCDAVSYCHWAGKRVCGVLGRAGETLGSWMDPESDFNLAVTDPERSQWYNACSSGGTNTYAYGETYDPACEGLADVGTRESCSTPGEQEVFDLSGNVEEWEDLCSSEGTCQRRGGYAGSAEATTCGDDVAASSASIPRARGGFRCCYEF